MKMLLIILLLGFAGQIMSDQNQTLQSQLDAKRNAFNSRADENKKQAYEEGVIDVIKQETTDKALQVGDKAPNFKLPNPTGNEIELYELLKNGPVILTWYRGGWCPYCNMTLHYYQEKLSEFEKNGAQLVAISPQKPDQSLNTQEKNDLEFHVLSDMNNTTAKEFNVIFKLTPEVEAYYKKAFSFKEYYDNETPELPLAATYIIGIDGVIKWAYLNPDYRNRAEPEDTINALKML